MNLALIDKEILIFLNGNHNPIADGVMTGVNNLFLSIPLFILLCIVMIKYFRINFHEKSFVPLNIVLVLFFFGLIIFIGKLGLPDLINNFIARPRPCYEPDLSSIIRFLEEDCMDKFIFFSYKAFIAFAISTFVFLSLPEIKWWIKLLILCWALLVSYSRIYLGLHYPFNVLFAIGLGIFAGFISFRAYFYMKNSVFLI